MKLASWHSDLKLAIWLTQHWCMYQGMDISWHQTRKDPSEACMCLGIHGLSHKNIFFQHQVQQYTLLDEACILLHNAPPYCAVKTVYQVFNKRFWKNRKVDLVFFQPAILLAKRSAQLAALPLWWHHIARDTYACAMLTCLPLPRSAAFGTLTYVVHALRFLSSYRRGAWKQKLYLTTWLRPSVPSVPLYCTSCNLRIFSFLDQVPDSTSSTSDCSCCNLYSNHRVLVLSSWTLITTLYSFNTCLLYTSPSPRD